MVKHTQTIRRQKVFKSILNATVNLFTLIFEQSCIVSQTYVRTFVFNAPFFYPLKTSENRKVFRFFKGQRKGALGTNGLD